MEKTFSAKCRCHLSWPQKHSPAETRWGARLVECQDRNLGPLSWELRSGCCPSSSPGAWQRCVRTPLLPCPSLPRAQPHSPECGIGALLVMELAVSRTLKKTCTSFMGYIIHSWSSRCFPCRRKRIEELELQPTTGLSEAGVKSKSQFRISKCTAKLQGIQQETSPDRIFHRLNVNAH